MRIVSLNAWGGKVWGPLEAWVPAVGADVLCMQEVTRAAEPSPEWLIYADAERRLDQRADLYGDVSRLLPQHDGSFAAAAQGPLQDARGRVYRSDHGIAVWVRRGLVVTGMVQRMVHGAYRHDGWGAAPVPRAMQALRLWWAEAGRSVVVAHLHGLRDPAGKGDTPARAVQADAMVALLDELREPGDLVVLAGDLNLLPDSATFGRLRAAGLRDLVTGRGFTDTRTSHYAKTPRYADYLLVSANVPVRAFDVLALPEVSDHRPLVLDIGA